MWGYRARAKLFLKLCEYERAMADANSIIEMGVESGGGHEYKGYALIGMNQFDEAIKEFVKDDKSNTFVNQVMKKKKEIKDYETEVTPLPDWYKNWILANQDESINTVKPEFVFCIMKGIQGL